MTEPPDDHPEWARYKRPIPADEQPDPEPPPDEASDAAATGRGGANPAPSEAPDPGRQAPDRGDQAVAPARTAPDRSSSPADVVRWADSAASLLPPRVAAVPSTWETGPPIPAELEARIRRDLVRGRKIVWLTWVAALASLILGLVAVRQATLLVAIDGDLVTTEEVEAAGASFDAARTVLIVAVVIGVLLALRWLRGALPVMEELQRRGVVDGAPPRSSAMRDRLSLLWRPSGVPADRAGWSDLRVGAGRRLAWIAVASVALATIVGLVAAIWLGAAQDADTSRLLRVVSGIDGALWLIASVLVGVAFDAMLWREAAAARALGVFIPLVDAPSRAIVRILPPILLFSAGVFVASVRPEPWFVDCPQATLACDGMLVPVDHEGGSHATIWIVYAVHRAATTPVGTLVIAVGGPGGSGLEFGRRHPRHARRGARPALRHPVLRPTRRRRVGGPRLSRGGLPVRNDRSRRRLGRDVRGGVHPGGGGRPGDARPVRHAPGGGRPRLDPRPARARAVRAVRRELRNRVRPGVCRRPPGAPGGADPRRRGRSDAAGQRLLDQRDEGLREGPDRHARCVRRRARLPRRRQPARPGVRPLPARVRGAEGGLVRRSRRRRARARVRGGGVRGGG